MFVLLSMLTVGLFSASDVSAASTDNQSSYQTAFLYFLPEYQGEDIEKIVNETNKCQTLGYTYTNTNCLSPYILKDKCPSGNYYKTCYCAGSSSCTGSAFSSNPYTETAGTTMTNCTDCSGNTKYNWTCDANGECDAYTLSSCPSHGNCSQCCNGNYKLDSCTSGYSVSDNVCEENCVPLTNETNCSYGTESCSDGCGGERVCCKSCEPLSDETGCSYGTYSCSDNCGGTRTCCSACTDTCSSKGYYSSSPSGKNCSATTVCGSTCYYDCVDTHTHSYSCPSGYNETNSWGSSAQTASRTCSCGETSGTCYKAPEVVDECAQTLEYCRNAENCHIVSNAKELLASNAAAAYDNAPVIVIDGDIDLGNEILTPNATWFVSIEAYAPACQRKASLKVSKIITNETFSGFVIPTTASLISVNTIAGLSFQSTLNADQIEIDHGVIDLGVGGTVGTLKISGNNASNSNQIYWGGVSGGCPWGQLFQQETIQELRINSFLNPLGSRIANMQIEDVKAIIPAELFNAYYNLDLEIYGAEVSIVGSLNQTLYFYTRDGSLQNKSCINDVCIDIPSASEIYCDKTGCHCQSKYCY